MAPVVVFQILISPSFDAYERGAMVKLAADWIRAELAKDEQGNAETKI